MGTRFDCCLLLLPALFGFNFDLGPPQKDRCSVGVMTNTVIFLTDNLELLSDWCMFFDARDLVVLQKA